MSNMHKTQTNKADGVADVWEPKDAELILRKVHEARVVMMVMRMAVEAQEDDAVNYNGEGVERWYSVADAACDRMQVVRDTLLQKLNAPTVDWFTPLNLMEALAAALWGGCGTPGGHPLDFCECVIMLDVIVQALDELLSDWDETQNQLPPASGLDDVKPPAVQDLGVKSSLKIVR